MSILLAAALALTPSDAGVHLTRPAPTVIEITGGSGAKSWKLRYGTQPHAFIPRVVPQLLLAEQGRAWFAHGSWLRLIDTASGTVVGRWRFPGAILRVSPQGSRLQVYVEEHEWPRWLRSKNEKYHQTILFDPLLPPVPYWPVASWNLFALPVCEAMFFRPPGHNVGICQIGSTKTPPDAARALIPQLEEAVRRDPLSPWLRIVLGKMLWSAGDVRAAEVFAEALRTPATDFIELLPISAFLARLGDLDAAQAAFDAGHRDFIRRGNDPRLFWQMEGRFSLYPFDYDSTGEKQRRHLENVYRLTPGARGAEFAWALYAEQLESEGRPADAQVWRERANTAAQTSLYVGAPLFSRVVDLAFLALYSSLLAAALYFTVLYARYRPEALLAARESPITLDNLYSLLHLEYWTWSQRVAFFSIALAGWLAAGFCGIYVLAFLRVEGAPVSAGMGSFAGPAARAYFESELPDTPERRSLLAMAQQHVRAGVSGVSVPSRSEMARAFAGGAPVLRALAGPFAGVFRISFSANDLRHIAGVVSGTLSAITLAVVFSLLLFLVPRKDAVEPPATWHRWCEALAPGTGTAWGAFGGLALFAWVGCIFAGLFWFSQGTPLVLTAEMCRPGRYLRVGPTYMDMINPSVWWLAGPALGVAAANILMMRVRRPEAQEAQEAAAGSLA